MKDKMKANFLIYSIFHSSVVVEGNYVGTENFISTLKSDQCIFFKCLSLKNVSERLQAWLLTWSCRGTNRVLQEGFFGWFGWFFLQSF